MDTAAVGAMDLIANPYNAVLMFAVWWLIQLPRKWWPNRFTGALMKKVTPVLAVVLCSGVVVLLDGRWVAEGSSVGEKIILGIVLGACTTNLHGFAKRLGIQGLMKLEPLKEKPLDLHRVIEKERD